jgi:HK97 family phage major capsid protein
MDLKSKLKQVEDDLSQLRNDRAEKAKARDTAKEAFAKLDGYDVESAEYKAAEAAIKSVSEVDEKIAQTQAAQVGILKMLGQQDPAAAPGARVEKTDDPERDAWNAKRIIESDGYKEMRSKGVFESSGRLGNLSLGQVASRDALKAEIGSTNVGGLIQPDVRGLVAPIMRPLRLLDLLPIGTTDSNSIEYVQETTLPLTTAAETVEGAAKPEAAYAFADATAPIRTIAHWKKVRKQTLADAAGLQTLMDTTLRYGVRRRLENQVLGGDGVGENIRGIINTSGIGTVAKAVGESAADALHHGIVAIQLADQEPGFVALHPTDWEQIRLSRDDSGAAAGTGGYLFGAPSQQGASTLWGLPVVVSPAMPVNTGLVGDAQAALVAIRSGVEVLVSDSDQDDFIKNRVTLLAEMRAGLLVWRPSGFFTTTGI